jgi:pimeloyl-ACP methyl ester carboxylesterase
VAVTGGRRDRRRVTRALRISGLAVLLVVALLGIDALAGVFYCTGHAAGLVTVSARSAAATRDVLVVFPGYGMPGDLLAEAFTPYLPEDQAMIVVRYAERGIDMDDVYQQIMAELRRLGTARITLYGASMGGMCARYFLERYRRDGAPFAELSLVLDSAPSAASRIRRPGWAFGAASWYRGGPLSTATWAAISDISPKATPEPDADPGLVARAQHAGAWIGTPALTTQAHFIGTFPPLRDGELVGVLTRAAYLRGSGSGADPLVITDASIEDWRRAFPGLTVGIVTGRDARWHLPLIERPHETMKAILAA